MDEEDCPPRIADLIGQRVDLLPERILRDLARRIPWRRARLAEPDHLQVTGDIYDGAIGVHAVLARSERLVNVVRIIVARYEDKRNARAVEPLGGKVEPLRDACPDLGAEQLVELGLVPAERIDLLLGCPQGVVAQASDVALERGEFLLVAGHPALAEQRRLPAVAGGDDR